jgi:hypothetical protein
MNNGKEGQIEKVKVHTPHASDVATPEKFPPK